MPLATATSVQQAYLAYFGRPADMPGLDFWIGKDSAAMTAGFAASSEYATMYSGMTADQRVEQVYQNLLGRASDPAGKAYWTAALTSGSQTVSSLVTSMQANALGIDTATIANRTTYAISFTAAMDTQAKVQAYTGTAVAAAARAATSAVSYTAASLTTATATIATDIAAINTGVAPAVAAATAAAAAATAAAAAAAGAFTMTESSNTTVTLTGSSTDAFAMTLGTTTATRAGTTVTPSSGSLQASDVTFVGTDYAGPVAITLNTASPTLAVTITTGTNTTNSITETGLNDAVAITLHGTTAATVNLVLGDLTSDSSGNITVVATTGTNLITTGSGNDVITGGAGADVMTGGTGNDFYIFTATADAGDKIIEAATAGTDGIYVNGAAVDMRPLSVSADGSAAAGLAIKTLTGIEQILLKVGSSTTFSALQLTASAVTINDDGSGATTINVTAANATDAIDLSSIVVTAGTTLGGVTPNALTAADIVTITGGTGINAIKAMPTVINNINGNGGNDTIVCASGIDKITLSVVGAANASTITVFTPATDKLVLSKTAFTALAGSAGATTLGADYLSVALVTDLTGGSVGASTDTQAIIFVTGTGNLYYNTDGVTGGGLILIGTLAATAVATTDFNIVT